MELGSFCDYNNGFRPRLNKWVNRSIKITLAKKSGKLCFDNNSVIKKIHKFSLKILFYFNFILFSSYLLKILSLHLPIINTWFNQQQHQNVHTHTRLKSITWNNITLEICKKTTKKKPNLFYIICVLCIPENQPNLKFYYTNYTYYYY